MTKKSAEVPETERDEPIHVFDQTNGVLSEDPASSGRPPGNRIHAAEGDVPGATHVVLGGW